MAMEVEDDVFFADLSKQISLLIMDDDDKDFPVKCSSLPVQGFPYVPPTIMPPPFRYEMAYRRESKGTGVFIPQSMIPRKKNKSGRTNPNNTNSRKQPDKPGVAVCNSSSSNNNMFSSNYSNCDVLKRHK